MNIRTDLAAEQLQQVSVNNRMDGVTRKKIVHDAQRLEVTETLVETQ